MRPRSIDRGNSNPTLTQQVSGLLLQDDGIGLAKDI
jgi:hypothetical protein